MVVKVARKWEVVQNRGGLLKFGIDFHRSRSGVDRSIIAGLLRLLAAPVLPAYRQHK